MKLQKLKIQKLFAKVRYLMIEINSNNLRSTLCSYDTHSSGYSKPNFIID